MPNVCILVLKKWNKWMSSGTASNQAHTNIIRILDFFKVQFSLNTVTFQNTDSNSKKALLIK